MTFTLATSCVLALSCSALAASSGVASELGLPMTFSDGTTTLVDVRYPSDVPSNCGWPVVIFLHGLGGSRIPQGVSAQSFASSGYFTIAYDIRGQGASTGLHTYFGQRERWDLVEVMRWAESKYDGLYDRDRVGLTGGSQGGILSWCAAAWGGEPLEPESHLPGRYPEIAAIVAENCAPDFEAMFAPQLIGVHVFTSRVLLQGDVNFDPVLRTKIENALRAEFWWGYQDLLVGNERDPHSRVPTLRVPTMAMMAYDDLVFPAAALAHAWEELPPGTPRKLYLGTGGHQSPGNSQELALREGWRRLWFDRFLKGDDNGIEQAPRVLYAITPDDPNVYQSLTSTWAHDVADEWPPADTLVQRWYLRDGGALSSQAPASDEGFQTVSQVVAPGYTMQNAVDTAFGLGSVKNHIPVSAVEYDSEVLTNSISLAGDAVAHLAVDASSSRYQLRVSLWDVPRSGSPRYVCGGSYFAYDTVAAGANEFDLELNANAYVWQRSHRLRVRVENLQIHEPPGTENLRFAPYVTPFNVLVRSAPTALSWIDLPVR